MITYTCGFIVTGKSKRKYEFVKLVSTADDSDHEGTTEEEKEDRKQTSTGSGCTKAIDSTVLPNGLAEVEPNTNIEDLVLPPNGLAEVKPPNNTNIEDSVLGTETPKDMTPIAKDPSKSPSTPVSATGTPAESPFSDKKDYKGLSRQRREFYTATTRDFSTSTTTASSHKLNDKLPVFHDPDQSCCK